MIKEARVEQEQMDFRDARGVHTSASQPEIQMYVRWTGPAEAVRNKVEAAANQLLAQIKDPGE